MINFWLLNKNRKFKISDWHLFSFCAFLTLSRQTISRNFSGNGKTVPTKSWFYCIFTIYAAVKLFYLQNFKILATVRFSVRRYIYCVKDNAVIFEYELEWPFSSIWLRCLPMGASINYWVRKCNCPPLKTLIFKMSLFLISMIWYPKYIDIWLTPF